MTTQTPFAYPSGYRYAPVRLLDANYTLVWAYFGPEFARERVIEINTEKESFFATHTYTQQVRVSDYSPFVGVYLLSGDASFLLAEHLSRAVTTLGRVTEIEALLSRAEYAAKFAFSSTSSSTPEQNHWSLRVHPEVRNGLSDAARLVVPGYLLQVMLQSKNLLEGYAAALVDLTVVDDTYSPTRLRYSGAIASWIRVYGLVDNFLALGPTLCYQPDSKQVVVWNPRNPLAALLAPVREYVSTCLATRAQALRASSKGLRLDLSFADEWAKTGARV